MTIAKGGGLVDAKLLRMYDDVMSQMSFSGVGVKSLCSVWALLRCLLRFCCLLPAAKLPQRVSHPRQAATQTGFFKMWL